MAIHLPPAQVLYSQTPVIELTKLQSQCQSYVTTDGQSANLSWCQAPIWGLRPDFYFCQAIAGLLMWGALSDERTDLPFTSTIAAGPRQRSHSYVRVPRDSWQYFTLSDSRLGGPGPRSYIPQEQGGRLYPQALGSLFIASYDSQGYDGGIRTRLHAGIWLKPWPLLINTRHGPHREHSSSIIVDKLLHY
jgi:hypothetical protein